MNEYAYQGLIRGLERNAEQQPASFRTKVLLLTGSAYLVLFGAASVIVLLLYLGIGWAREQSHFYALARLGLFALFLAPLFFVILRMFLMRLPPPEGRPLAYAEGPKLFAAIEELRTALKAKPIHCVLLDRSFNAAVAQIPRWGLFGGYRNYLIVGMPYLLGVAPKEMLATLAHECGHLAGGHSKLSAWIYRQHHTFAALQQQVRTDDPDNWFNGLITSGIARFLPYLSAHTFVLSRRNEYEADEAATRLVGKEPNATGLIREALIARWLRDTFWPRHYRQAETVAEPRIKPFGALKTLLVAGHAQWSRPDWLADAWRESSDLHDTHPCLRDRVEAIGAPRALPPPLQQTAAEAFLGPGCASLVKEFDDAWWHDERKNWQGFHRRITEARARIDLLSRRPLAALNLQELHDLAMLKAEFESLASAKPALEQLLDQPGGPYSKAMSLYGRALLNERDDRGLQYLKDAAAVDRGLRDDCANVGARYLADTRGDEAAHRWWDDVMQLESAN